MLTRILQLLLVLDLTAAAGCAHQQPDPRRVIRTAKKGLVAIDVLLEQLRPVIDEATGLRIKQCAQTEPGPERDACLGAFTTEVAPIAKKIAELYDQTVETLDELDAAWAELEPLIAAAKREVAAARKDGAK